MYNVNSYQLLKYYMNNFLYLYNWLNNWTSNMDLSYYMVLLMWLLEWLFMLNFLFIEGARSYIIFFFKIPFFIILFVLYWLYLWILAVWRSSQFGSFTRGDRKLWFKGYAAFWIIELVTVISFIMIYCWLSWGPSLFVVRYFLMPRSGFFLEFMCYTYLLFLAYFASLGLSWNLWNWQLIITLMIIMMLSYLLWRDIIILLTKELIINNSSAYWRNMKLNSLVYSLSHEWWAGHMLGRSSVLFKYIDIDLSFMLDKYPLMEFISLTEYESSLFIINILNSIYLDKFYWIFNWVSNVLFLNKEVSMETYKSFFYPSSLGFTSKRITFWEFLLFLKIWHQLIILVWWIFYMFKLNSTHMGSYQILSICYFNLYCCYLLSLFMYIMNYLYMFEFMFKLSPDLISLNFMMLMMYDFIYTMV